MSGGEICYLLPVISFPRPKSRFWLKSPAFFGWVSTLLVIEETALADSFLFHSTGFGFWTDYSLRAAFLLGLGLFVILFNHRPHFYPGFLALASLLCLGLSFAPFASGVPFFFQLGFALFSGASLARFGIAFFLDFDNREKGVSLLIALALSLPLYAFRFGQNWPSLSLVLFGLLLAFFPRVESKASASLPLEHLPEWWLLLLAFCAFLLQGVLELSLLRYLLVFDPSSLYPILAGGAVGLALGFFFLKSRRFLLTDGLYFAFWLTSLGALLLFFIAETAVLFVLAALFACSHVLALFSLYYILGVYTKKYRNITFYDLGALLSSLAYASSLLLPLLFPFSFPANASYWALIFLSVPLLLFAAFPLFLLRQNQKEWLLDLRRDEVTNASPLDAFFTEHHLSKREREVAYLLLKGRTLRQIAGELVLSYPTINTYQTSLYRKLGINSRAELLLLCHPLLRDNQPH